MFQILRLGLLALLGTTAAAGPVVEAVLDAAIGTDRVAPTSIVSIYGTGLATCTEQASDQLPLTMCDGTVRVRVNGVRQRLFFVSGEQINVLFEAALPAGAARLEVVNGTESNSSQVIILKRAPQIFVVPRFSGRRGGFAAAQRFPDYDLVDFTAPAEGGDVLVLYGTGFGSTPADPLPDVFLRGKGLRVLGAASSPGFAGLFQAAIELPDVTGGIHELQLCYESGAYCSEPVEIPVTAAESYFAGWVRHGEPVEIFIGGESRVETTATGAFLVELSAARTEVEIDAGPEFYRWRDRFQTTSGWNAPRAVARLNQPFSSGDIRLLPRREAIDLDWSYDGGWLQAGRAMTLLDLMRAYGEEASRGCGPTKTFRRTDNEYPVLYWVDSDSEELMAAVEGAVALWNKAARSLFELSAERQEWNLRIVEAPPPGSPNVAAAVITEEVITCVAPSRQTLYVNPAFREDLVNSGASAGEIVRAMTRVIAQQVTRCFGWLTNSPSPALIMHRTPFVDQPHSIELDHAHYWNSLPNGTLIDRFSE